MLLKKRPKFALQQSFKGEYLKAALNRRFSIWHIQH